MPAVTSRFRSAIHGLDEHDLGMDLVEDYGKRIQQARMQRGWTREELARRVFEKESVIQRIESNSLTPSDELIEKLERVLSIKLRTDKAE
jgi:putative transcription factor